MGFSRLPRFKRATVSPVHLTERDREIVRLVCRHRFLRSCHIATLMGGSSQQLLRRLRLLYHHGFLERPRAQIEYHERGGSRHIVYGLGNKGAAILKEDQGVRLRNLRWGEKNRSIRRIFFEHSLLVSDVMVALELACRKGRNVSLLAGDELPRTGATKPGSPFKWPVQLSRHVKLGVLPDRVFALDVRRETAMVERAFYFLEVDRGTMPVVRRNLAQSSMYRKFLAYEATWAQSIHRKHFGFHRFRVLTVTTSVARVGSLIDACSQLKKGRGLFLFVDQATLERHGDILTVPCQTARLDKTATLLS